MADPAHASRLSNAPAATAGLRLRDVSVSFGSAAILRGFSSDLQAGEITAILGASGVGKSTLLRRIAGLVGGPGDVVATDGESLQDRVAFMGQSDLLLPWLSVASNASLGARLRGERRDPGRLQRVLRDVELTDAAQLRPAALSGGMRQRAALARTLMEDRPIVLMDEPFSAVDALTRLRLQDLALRVLRGRTVVLVTHDPWEAIRIADRIVVLSGRPAESVLDTRPEGDAPRAPDSAGARELWRTVMVALGHEAASA